MAVESPYGKLNNGWSSSEIDASKVKVQGERDRMFRFHLELPLVRPGRKNKDNLYAKTSIISIIETQKLLSGSAEYFAIKNVK